MGRSRGSRGGLIGLFIVAVLVVLGILGRHSSSSSHSTTLPTFGVPQFLNIGQSGTTNAPVQPDNGANSIPVTVTASSLTPKVSPTNGYAVAMTYCAVSSPIDAARANSNLAISLTGSNDPSPTFNAALSTPWSNNLSPGACQSGTSYFTSSTPIPVGNQDVTVRFGPELASNALEWTTIATLPPPP